MDYKIDFNSINERYKVDKASNEIIKELKTYGRSTGDIEEINNLLTYNLSLKGKRIRLIKLITISRLTGRLNNLTKKIIYAMELANSAIFIHDDIIDHDLRRKGKPTLNSLVGYEKALLIGNILHSIACKELCKLCDCNKNKEIIVEILNSLAIEHAGQYSDINFRWNFCHSLKDWERMIMRHSAYYIISTLIGIAKLNKADKKIIRAIRSYEENCTLAGAAEDALLGFLGKKPAGDLKNGSFTILTSFAFKNNPKRILKGPDLLRREINESKAIDLTLRYISKRVRKAVKALDSIKDCYEKEVLIFLARQILDEIK